MTFQATPDFKGIKTSVLPHILTMLCFRPPLISKGLRLAGWLGDTVESGFRPPLISKGLRLCFRCDIAPVITSFQATPDFKGIKTSAPLRGKGTHRRFRPPLISKGLRHYRRQVPPLCHCFRPPLISKGLRLLGHVNSSHAFSFQATS